MRMASAQRGYLFFQRTLFLVYLLLLVWAPLPLGSNRVWAWSLLQVGVFSLGALVLLAWAINPQACRPDSGTNDLVGRGKWVAIGLLLLWLAYLGLQMLTIPLPLLDWLAPTNASWWHNLPPSIRSEEGRLAASLQSARTEWLKQCAYTVFFCLTLVLVSSSKRLRIVIYAMIGTATFEAVYGLAAHFMQDNFPFWRPTWYGHHWATGTFINKNHYAAHLSFGIALMFGVCLAFLSRQPYREWPRRFAVMLERVTGVLLEPGYLRFGLLLALLTAFFFSQSRGAFMGLVLAGSGLLLFGAWWRDYRTDARSQGRIPSAEKRLLPWLLLTGLAAAVWLSSSGLFGRLLPSELADMGRVVTWQQTLVMWWDHWLFGIGNGNFEYVFTRYRVPALDGSVYDFAHNDHLQLLAEQGVIGLVLFYAVFGVCWFVMLKAYCKRGRSKSKQGVLLGIMIAVSAFFLHGFVDFNFHIPANALWFYALLGLGLVSSARIVRG